MGDYHQTTSEPEKAADLQWHKVPLILSDNKVINLPDGLAFIIHDGIAHDGASDEFVRAKSPRGTHPLTPWAVAPSWLSACPTATPPPIATISSPSCFEPICQLCF